MQQSRKTDEGKAPHARLTSKATGTRLLSFSKAVRDGDWKLILGKSPELYRISEDRNEKNNLAAKFPDQVWKMKQIHAKAYSRR